MMGLIDSRAGMYRLCTERLPRDRENPVGLDETTIPGGRYLRLRLIGDPPDVYGQIAAAFDELFEHADHDPTRPLIEFYRRESEVDCLVPVNAAVTGA
jgi:DNA gyrase inhibitor GyrI